MIPVVLIAVNYVREQRSVLLLLAGWVMISAALVSYGQLGAEDAIFLIKQQAMYGMAISGFLAALAIHNDRRSRRILTVLSKGIRRSEYLAGLIFGLLLLIGIYCVMIGAFASWVFASLGLPVVALWYFLLEVMVVSAATAATATFFASFLPPLFAITATAAAVGSALASAGFGWPALLPTFRLLASITAFIPRSDWQPTWDALAWGILQSVVLWLLASWVFSGRDIAVAVE